MAQATRTSNSSCCVITGDLFLVFLAIIFPPLPVWIKRGLCSADSIINICLLCLGYFPGLIHSWYIIAKYPEDTIVFSVDTENLHAGSTNRQYEPLPSSDSRPALNDASTSNYGTASTSNNHSERASQGPLPSYEDAVKDNKIQRG